MGLAFITVYHRPSIVSVTLFIIHDESERSTTNCMLFYSDIDLNILSDPLQLS